MSDTAKFKVRRFEVSSGSRSSSLFSFSSSSSSSSSSSISSSSPSSRPHRPPPPFPFSHSSPFLFYTSVLSTSFVSRTGFYSSLSLASNSFHTTVSRRIPSIRCGIPGIYMKILVYLFMFPRRDHHPLRSLLVCRQIVFPVQCGHCLQSQHIIQEI